MVLELFPVNVLGKVHYRNHTTIHIATCTCTHNYLLHVHVVIIIIVNFPCYMLYTMDAQNCLIIHL